MTKHEWCTLVHEMVVFERILAHLETGIATLFNLDQGGGLVTLFDSPLTGFGRVLAENVAEGDWYDSITFDYVFFQRNHDELQPFELSQGAFVTTPEELYEYVLPLP